jgi:diguanylate cyclase (GGDEF)-like protein
VIIAVVVILVLIVLGLVIYNVNIHKKIQKFKNMNQKITNLYVVQDFVNAIGETSTVEEKIKKINDILIERYEIKYSTIVVFDGAEYQVKASNVDQKHWNALKSLQNVDMFKDSIQSATPKYVTVNNENERLPYQETEFGRAKSAIFFPLYIDNVYIGYWIMESGTPHDFDNVDTTVLEVIKENIVSVLKTVVHQKTLESIVRKDLFTGLYSEEYLYGEGKKIIDQYTISTICMFKIINIQEINRKYSRELGNKVITQISQYIAENISKEYVFIRYMGPKFVIAFSGVDTDGVANFLNDIKEKIETMQIELTAEERKEMNLQVKESAKGKKETDNKEVAIPKLNFVISSYYKGTGLEEVLKKLEEYLDHADVQESDITNI